MSRYKRMRELHHRSRHTASPALSDELAQLGIEHANDLAFRILQTDFPEPDPPERLRAFFELFARLRDSDVPVWIGGDWVADFYLGKVLGPHAELELYAAADVHTWLAEQSASETITLRINQLPEGAALSDRAQQLIWNDQRVSARVVPAEWFYLSTLDRLNRDPSWNRPKIFADLRALLPLLHPERLQQTRDLMRAPAR
jgi:hypothetical protein